MDKKTQALVEQYVKSLVEVAIEKDSLAELQSETRALLSVLEETNLVSFLSSLVVSCDEKVKLVRLLQESSSVYMSNFLEVILQNEREALLKDILEGVQKDFVIATNQHDIVVTTAVALTDEQKEHILALVTEKFGVKAGKLVEDIGESTLGGFIISVNNKIIDTNIRRQLQTFKMNLKQKMV